MIELMTWLMTKCDMNNYIYCLFIFLKFCIEYDSKLYIIIEINQFKYEINSIIIKYNNILQILNIIYIYFL